MLYSDNTFSFSDTISFLYFSKTILPHRLHAVKVIQLEPTWLGDADFKIALVQMTLRRIRGLREIRIMIAAKAGPTQILRVLNGRI